MAEQTISEYAKNHRLDCWYKNVCSEEICRDSCTRFKEMSELLKYSGIPPAQQVPITLRPWNDHDKNAFTRLKAIQNTIVDYVEAGNNLYICSENPGNGKTSWSLKLMLRYFDRIWMGNGYRVRGVFVHVPTFLTKLKNFNYPLSEEYKQNLLDADLVIWDDIASTNLSNYDYSQLLIYIDNRLFNKRANIYTSNITDKNKLISIMGDRLASRIYTNSEVVEFIGKDWRSMKE